MQIISRLGISADGYVTTPDGGPAQLADPAFVSGQRSRPYRALGALDKLELVVLPLLLGDGMRLTPHLRPEIALTFERERERALPGGSVEIVYAVN